MYRNCAGVVFSSIAPLAECSRKVVFLYAKIGKFLMENTQNREISNFFSLLFEVNGFILFLNITTDINIY